MLFSIIVFIEIKLYNGVHEWTRIQINNSLSSNPQKLCHSPNITYNFHSNARYRPTQLMYKYNATYRHNPTTRNRTNLQIPSISAHLIPWDSQVPCRFYVTGTFIDKSTDTCGLNVVSLYTALESWRSCVYKYTFCSAF